VIGTAQQNVWAMFFGRPISLGIIAFILLSLFYPMLARRWQVQGGTTNAD